MASGKKTNPACARRPWGRVQGAVLCMQGRLLCSPYSVSPVDASHFHLYPQLEAGITITCKQVPGASAGSDWSALGHTGCAEYHPLGPLAELPFMPVPRHWAWCEGSTSGRSRSFRWWWWWRGWGRGERRVTGRRNVYGTSFK